MPGRERGEQPDLDRSWSASLSVRIWEPAHRIRRPIRLPLARPTVRTPSRTRFVKNPRLVAKKRNRFQDELWVPPIRNSAASSLTLLASWTISPSPERGGRIGQGDERDVGP